MNFSLRNLALAAVVSVAGSVVAQDAVVPTVTKKWSYEALTSPGKNDSRFGTGVNGKIYYNDKANGKVVVIDETGTQSTYAEVAGVGTGISSDDAGNLIVNLGFPNASSGANFTIITTEGEQKPFTLAYPDDLSATRLDQLGTTIGDVMSEDGAFLYVGGNTVNKVVLAQFKNGEQITDELGYYSSEDIAAPVINTSAVVQPIYTFQETLDMGDDAINAFAIRNRSSKNVYIYNGDGELAPLPAPANANTQEGFEVFILGDVLYQVLPIKGKSGVNYSNEFVIADEEGNVIFTEELGGEDGSQNFASFAAHKVSDEKVELYFYSSTGKGITCAMYDIEIPGEPEPQVELPLQMYVRGSMLDWAAEAGWSLAPTFDVEAPVANENGEYEYKASFDVLQGEFKLDGSGDWSKYNYGAAEGANTVAPGATLEAWSGSNVNFSLGGKTYTDVTMTFYYNPDAEKASRLVFEGTEFVEPAPELPLVMFVRGEMLDWAADYGYSLAPKYDVENPEPNENGEYVYEAGFDYLYGDFKLDGSGDWSKYNYGAQGEDPIVLPGKTNQAWSGSSVNFSLNGKQYTDVTMTFYYNPDASKASWLKFEGTEYVEPTPTTDKSQFAYGLELVKGENNAYTVTFKSTGDAAKAVLVATAKDNADLVYEQELGAVVKGENTFSFDANELPVDGAYNWAISIHNYTIEEDVITTPVVLGRVAVTCMTDPEFPEVYGYTVIGLNKNSGINVYNPAGELVQDAVHQKCEAMGGTGANGSCPMDGTQRGNEVYFASWGDKACGVVAYDLTTPDVAPYNVFEGTNNGIGIMTTADGVQTGSGTPTVGIWGEGENTTIITYDEDIFKNKLAKNVIGNGKTTGNPLELVGEGFGGNLVNTNTALKTVKNGVFVTQRRANGMETAIFGLGYITLPEAELIWTAGDMVDVDPEFLPSANNGVDVNQAGDLLAISTYTGVNVYLLSWEDNKPVLEPYKSITSPMQGGKNTLVKFDAGNNIHVSSETMGYYTIAMADEEPISTTPAPSTSAIEKTSDVKSISVEAANDGEAVYYNVNGVKVNGNNLPAGVYVKVVGKTATKVVVK